MIQLCRDLARLAEGAGGGGAEQGDEEGEQRDGDDRRGDHAEPGGADGGQILIRGTDTGHPAEFPDQRGDGQDDQPGDHVCLEHDAAEGGERDRGSRPGQRRPLAGQAGIALLRVVVPRGPAGRGFRLGHRRAEASRTTAETTAMPAIVAARTQGMIDLGSGSPRRSARWLRTHSAYATTASTAPRTMSGTPSRWRPIGTPGKGGSSWTMPSPATTSASAVRLQARNVRSLANVNLGSGSVPSWSLATARGRSVASSPDHDMCPGSPHQCAVGSLAPILPVTHVTSPPGPPGPGLARHPETSYTCSITITPEVSGSSASKMCGTSPG